ncbi:MAG: peptidoglycan-binding protein LysM [Rhodothermaceae bacterium]|nr:MAG: peptidoglycan-binding protein LysM [Rhodothermaceae bacterium]
MMPELRGRTALRLALLLVLLVLPAGSSRARQAVPTHVVRPGDTLFGIARQHGLAVDDLRRWNALTDDRIRIGQTLRLGPPGGEATTTKPTSPARYVPRPGETLYDVAAAFGIPVDTLFVLNDSLRAPLGPDRPIRLPAGPASVSHTVRPGDTLFGIARHYGVTVDAIRQANRLSDDRIRVGQVLRVPAPGVLAPPPEAVRDPLLATGRVVVYPPTFAGRLMANGEPYNPERFTVSHRTLPLGTLVLLIDPASGRRTFAEVTDRGPVQDEALMDVSAAVARVLHLTEHPDAPIALHRVH